MPTANMGRIAFVNKGQFVLGTAYKKNDVVKDAGCVYAALFPNTNISLTNVTYWDKWIDISEVASVLTHNALQELQGGEVGGRFHLTQAELTKLQEGYTKAQVDTLFDNLNLIEKSSTPVLGLLWNQTEDLYKRIGKNINIANVDGFNEFSAWLSPTASRQNDNDTAAPSALTKWLDETANLPFSSMKRTIYDNTGSVVKLYTANNYTHADQTGLLVTEQIAVPIPAFYYIQAQVASAGKNYHLHAISNAPFTIDVVNDLGFVSSTITVWNPITNVSSGTVAGSVITSAYHPAFRDNASNILSKRAYGAFNAVSGRSICGSSVKATGMITRAAARTSAQGFGGGFTLIDFFLESAKNILALVERGTFYFDTGKWRGYDWNTSAVANDQDNGLTLSLLNKTGVILNGSNQVIANSYRGIENYHSALWRFIDGVNSSNYSIYLAKPKATFTDDTTAAPYFDSGYDVPAVSAVYTSDFNAGSFIPSAVAGSATTKAMDGCWCATGYTILYVGGTLANGSLAGLSAWSSGSVSSFAVWSFVGRPGL